MTHPRRGRKPRDPPVHSSFLFFYRFVIRLFDVCLKPEDLIFKGAGISPDNPPQNSGLTNQPPSPTGAGETESELTAIRQSTDTARPPGAPEFIGSSNAKCTRPSRSADGPERTPQRKAVHAGVRSVASYEVVPQTDTVALRSLPSGLLFRPAFPREPIGVNQLDSSC